jgi:hypothetical protein
MRKLGGILTVVMMACMVVPATVTPSDAAQRHHYARHQHRVGAYDGLWSVSIVTQYGPCDRSYRYPARIIGNRVTQADNDFSYRIYGSVSPRGAISVTVSKGGQSATGFGRLYRSRGGGRWSAAGGQCSGTWSAIRRG